MPRIPRGALALLGVVLLALLFAFGQRFGEDRQPADTLPVDRPVATAGAGEIAYDALPDEAHAVIEAIEDGGPFEHVQDGGVFGNREGLLPKEERGHYREYTVPTPGESDRGARRIVAGADGTLYWTVDHYASFREIVGLP